MTIIDIYQVFAKIAAAYPIQDATYKQIQGFYVLDDPAEMNTANLGKSKMYAVNNLNKSLFYNKRWQNKDYNVNDTSFDFPILVCFQTNFKSLDLNRLTYSIPIYVVGKTEIESDNIVFEVSDTILESMLLNVLKQFEGFLKFDGEWSHITSLAQEKQDKATETIIQVWKNRNNLEFVRERVGVQRLSAVTCTLEIQLSKCDFLSFEY